MLNLKLCILCVQHWQSYDSDGSLSTLIASMNCRSLLVPLLTTLINGPNGQVETQ